MANSYEVVTCLTGIPASAITQEIDTLLLAVGFQHELWPVAAGTEPVVYIYSEDSPRELDLDPLDLDDEEYEAIQDHPLVERAQDGESIDILDVLQLVLEGLDPERYPYIDVQAGYWSDKARPGEFGGWSARITRNGVVTSGTNGFFGKMDAEPARLRHLNAVCQAAKRSPNLSEVEQQAIDTLSDEVAQHPMARAALSTAAAPMRYYAVGGRLENDDEASIRLFQADSREHAIEQFEDDMLSGLTEDERDRTECFVDFVVCSNAPIAEAEPSQESSET